MDPATADELDQIIRELMADDGPPLLVANDRGEAHPAGVRVPNPAGTWSRWAKGANNADQVKLRWEELRRQIDTAWKGKPPKRDNETVHEVVQRLAGDVFHGDLERMDLKAAIAKAINEGREADVKRIAAEAIAKAVKGQSG